MDVLAPLGEEKSVEKKEGLGGLCSVLKKIKTVCCVACVVGRKTDLLLCMDESLAFGSCPLLSSFIAS